MSRAVVEPLREMFWKRIYYLRQIKVNSRLSVVRDSLLFDSAFTQGINDESGHMHRQCIRFINSTSCTYLNKQCGWHSILGLLWFQIGKHIFNEFIDISTFCQTMQMQRFSWLMGTLCCWSFFAKIAWTGNMVDSSCISPIYLNASSSILLVKVSAENKFRKWICKSVCRNIEKEQ